MFRNVNVGKIHQAQQVDVGHGVRIYAEAGVFIGKNVRIKRGATILTSPRLLELIGSQLWMKDVFIHKNSTVENGRIIHGGTNVYPDSRVLYNCIDLNKPKDSSMIQIEAQPTFFVGTGRVGTTSVVKFLNEASHFATHEAIPVSLALCGIHHMLPREVILKVLYDRYSFLIENEIWPSTFFDSNGRNFEFIEELRCLFPNARFIHLWRPLYGFVQSALARGAYLSSQPLTDVSRHYPLASGAIGMEPSDWNKLNQIQKITAQWIYVNTKASCSVPIENQFDITNEANRKLLIESLGVPGQSLVRHNASSSSSMREFRVGAIELRNDVAFILNTKWYRKIVTTLNESDKWSQILRVSLDEIGY